MTNITRSKLLDLTVIDHIKYENSRNGLAKQTRRNLRNIASQFNRYLKANGQRVDADSISEFLAQLQPQQAPPTWNLSRQNLKKVIKNQPGISNNYLKRVIVEEVFSDIKSLRPDKKVVDYLTYPQVLELILGSETTSLIIEFLFKTGCRISELINVRNMDINVDEQVRIKLMGKGSKQRTVFIDQKLYTRIRGQFQGLHYLFENSRHHKLDRSNLYREITNAGERILGRKIHPHLLRHSTANYLLKDCSMSPKFVALYMGHSDPAITQSMYIHDKPGTEVVDLFKVDRGGRVRNRNR
ncbi:MAG: tyrosine-type recombinase/integrase [Candidatus Cloacimonetes bacterium]|nr:tyrosine-type recombinase/integrase [Candidatus Cloacimonadota bacterium]